MVWPHHHPNLTITLTFIRPPTSEFNPNTEAPRLGFHPRDVGPCLGGTSALGCSPSDRREERPRNLTPRWDPFIFPGIRYRETNVDVSSAKQNQQCDSGIGSSQSAPWSNDERSRFMLSWKICQPWRLVLPRMSASAGIFVNKTKNKDLTDLGV